MCECAYQCVYIMCELCILLVCIGVYVCVSVRVCEREHAYVSVSICICTADAILCATVSQTHHYELCMEEKKAYSYR